MEVFKEYECLLSFGEFDAEYVGITDNDSLVLGFQTKFYQKGISKHLHFYVKPKDLIDFDGKINLKNILLI